MKVNCLTETFPHLSSFRVANSVQPASPNLMYFYVIVILLWHTARVHVWQGPRQYIIADAFHCTTLFLPEGVRYARSLDDLCTSIRSG
uniref:AlNc14C67G4745 protein n=1 Tax=Albugo laibachii Nc14 TaxID=890382 RepID=F0WDM5_9STRA|nr:AlNc14C67G4745 [Albugo laibachii Nc14]|eukprot:CCA19300.1 AlNc14C67G4745 [Albugo laibachii Nc14]